jgi:hypothetical protein
MSWDCVRANQAKFPCYLLVNRGKKEKRGGKEGKKEERKREGE